jgi:hypothetical protein
MLPSSVLTEAFTEQDPNAEDGDTWVDAFAQHADAQKLQHAGTGRGRAPPFQDFSAQHRGDQKDAILEQFNFLVDSGEYEVVRIAADDEGDCREWSASCQASAGAGK